MSLKDTDNLLTSNRFDLCDSVRVTQNNTNLRGSQALLRKLADMIFNVFRRDFEPGGRTAFVRQGTLGDTLSGSMHTTHTANISIKESTMLVSHPVEAVATSPWQRFAIQYGSIEVCRRQPLLHTRHYGEGRAPQRLTLSCLLLTEKREMGMGCQQATISMSMSNAK